TAFVPSSHPLQAAATVGIRLVSPVSVTPVRPAHRLAAAEGSTAVGPAAVAQHPGSTPIPVPPPTGTTAPARLGTPGFPPPPGPIGQAQHLLPGPHAATSPPAWEARDWPDPARCAAPASPARGGF